MFLPYHVSICIPARLPTLILQNKIRPHHLAGQNNGGGRFSGIIRTGHNHGKKNAPGRARTDNLEKSSIIVHHVSVSVL